MPNVLVPGGNGFIGTEICRVAVQNGHDVAAFARSGRPPLTPARHPWVQDVEWRAADVFEPDTWYDLLEGADAVVHCIATLCEARNRKITYEHVNGDSAVQVADEAAEAGVDSLVFLSARDKPPVISPRFLAAKRHAEEKIPETHPGLHFASLRPNLVFGKRQPGTATLAGILRQLEGLRPHPYTSPEGRPLPVELVAAAAVHAATTPELEGILSVSQIADLGRTSGLIDPDDVSEPTLLPLAYGLAGATLGGWLLSRWLRR